MPKKKTAKVHHHDQEQGYLTKDIAEEENEDIASAGTLEVDFKTDSFSNYDKDDEETS